MPGGRAMWPEPNGQMPASARNRVLLPEPDRPAITVDSPGGNASRACSISREPSGNCKVTSSSRIGPGSPVCTVAPLSASARAARIAVSKLSSRVTVARQEANEA